jgi:hypothetical protein
VYGGEKEGRKEEKERRACGGVVVDWFSRSIKCLVDWFDRTDRSIDRLTGPTRMSDTLFVGGLYAQVRILEVTAVDAASFHARFSARERRYIYRLVTGRRWGAVLVCGFEEVGSPGVYTRGPLK